MAAACLGAFAVPSVAEPGAVPGCAGHDAAAADGWTTVRPSFGGRTGAKIVDIAVLPLDPDVVYATDGRTVSTTRDGGCTWRDVTGGGSGLPEVATRQIVDIDVSYPDTDGLTTVWLLSTVSVGGSTRPEVLVAEDGEEVATGSGTWVLGGPPVGLPVGEGVTIAAGTDPENAYVVVNVPGAGRQLLATADRGVLWEQRGLSVGADIIGVVADSVYPNRVWMWGRDGLRASGDGGATFALVEEVPGAVLDVDVAQSPKGTRLAVLQPNGTLWRSDDVGQTWRKAPVDLRSMVVGAVPNDIDVAVVAGRGVVTVMPAVFRPYDASPAGEVWVDDLGIGLDGDVFRMVMRTQDVLRQRDVGVDTGAAPPGTPPTRRPGVTLLGPLPRIPLYPALLPTGEVVTLAPGETRDVAYELELPATPTPLDVHFVIDTTGSMQPVIDALRLALAKIVNDLTAAGIEAHFGVSDFRDVPRSPWGGNGDYVYRLSRGIGPVDSDLRLALEGLRAGGGGDGPESQFAAVYEAVRHAAGRPTMMPEPQPDTGWRSGALRVAVVATDTSSHREGDRAFSGSDDIRYPPPDYDTVLAALLKAKVRTMGIAAGSQARGDLSSMANDTGSVAPAGGIDCNADGKPDIAEGKPLVCDFQPGALSNVPTPVDPILGQNGAKSMSSALIAMLRGVHDPAPIRVRSSRPDVARVLKGSFQVDLKTANALPVLVRYTCTAARYGTTTPVRLPAYAGSRLVAEATSAVRCGAPAPPPVEDVVPPQAPPRVVAPAVGPPPPPPAPVSQIQTNPNPNLNPNPNPNPNLQSGLAAEEQQQAQLALVWDAARQPGEEEVEVLAMSRTDDSLAAAGVLCAGVVLAGAAYGLQVRRRTQVAPARRSC